MRKFSIIILLLLIILALHLTGIFAGLYECKTVCFIDDPQHILGGIIFSLIWLMIAKNQLSKTALFLSTISFAVFGSFLWELLEFTFWQWIPSLALKAKLFSPTVFDALTDIFYGLIGGAIAATISICKNRTVMQSTSDVCFMIVNLLTFWLTFDNLEILWFISYFQ